MSPILQPPEPGVTFPGQRRADQADEYLTVDPDFGRLRELGISGFAFIDPQLGLQVVVDGQRSEAERDATATQLLEGLAAGNHTFTYLRTEVDQ